MKQLSFDNLHSENEIEKKEKVGDQPDTLKNEQYPTDLVANFKRFITYMIDNTVMLTKTKGYISRKYLPAINDCMTIKAKDVTPRSEQDQYPYIHFLFHLAISGRLLEKEPAKAGQFQLRETERMELYNNLTDTEKYFFLLETFWVDVNWSKLQGKSDSIIALQLVEIFSELSNEKPGQMLASLMYDWHYFVLYFEWLGLWICEEDIERKERRGSKGVYYARSIKTSPFGAEMMRILLFSRNALAWNITFRREGGEFNAIPGTSVENDFAGDLSEEDANRLVSNISEDQSTQPFFQPFKELFPKDELQCTLPRNRQKFIDGVYTFKVSLSKGIRRTVVLSAIHTMEDLHAIILRAFQFEDDHLYSFFMDGQKWSRDCIASPNDDFGHADASQIQIGAVGLMLKQDFLYVFDYGDEWTFTVEVDQINADVQDLIHPYVKEEKGKAP